MERIGIFGGTFDPLHYGHLAMAYEAHQELLLDKVLFVVSGSPWQKGEITPPEVRYMMTQDAVERLFWAEASDVEIMRDGPTYTIDTVRELAQPGNELFLLLGQDQFDNLHTWKESQFIEGYATIHVMRRWLNLSSTAVRERVIAGKPIDYLVPPEVSSLVETFQLYRNFNS